MPPPLQIGRYRLERRLGSGAFATVWLAHDDLLEAPVAVKVMAENWAYRMDIRERFLSEARLLRRASSSSVVQVFDIGQLPDERPYFVMEHADRGTLEDRLSHGPMPVAEAVRLAAETAHGVAALHEAGILHRDIKPSNVLITSAAGGRERVLVADLGLAKSLAHASGLTMAAGSAGYMAPEQAEPTAGIDERADVYGLGALAYHLVTGSVPGSPGKVVPAGDLRPDLPEGVRRAIQRAMEPDREDRWPTAASFAAELEKGLDKAHDKAHDKGLSEPVSAPADEPGRAPGDSLSDGRSQGRSDERQTEQPDDPPAGSPRRRARRTPLVAALTAAVLVLAGSGVAAYLISSRSAPDVVEVSDATKRIRVQVPAAWGRQVVTAGWNPGSLGLTNAHEPGLAVANDLSGWPDLNSQVDGVFVGLTDQSALPGRVNMITHDGCRYDSDRAYDGGGWKGEIRRWVGCASGSLEEIHLTRAGGGTTQVYVQIRQQGDTDATDRILRTLEVED
ncbi:protein kinase domain-containing protein [Planotetraspora kaengkrachanensis]|uniref:non-specific serine/threonine protein kinase n=1 Tax=Planotetraspora kaengkrachanensis TaxID=575193 RepID=A0A8J3V716_9ACTN|nr:protein kinase [Planotetraspora kaengkrachanensis]GIG81940.1 serine/threonine protein kinase [Planotetraspora kaengkrachanensis]